MSAGEQTGNVLSSRPNVIKACYFYRHLQAFKKTIIHYRDINDD